MPELRFAVESVSAADPAAFSLLFRVRVENAVAGEEVQSISLKVQLHVHPARRSYTQQEQLALHDLFGERERWAITLRPLFWTNTSLNVPGFRGSTIVELPVCCSRYPDDAAAKYCHALREGDITVELLFNGTVFYLADRSLRVAFIPWSSEATCRIPVALLQHMSGAAQSHSIREIPHGMPGWQELLEQARAAGARRKP